MCGRSVRPVNGVRKEHSSGGPQAGALAPEKRATLFKSPLWTMFLPVGCCLLTALSGVCAAEGFALQFNGTSNRVDVATALVSEDITMSVWVKPDTPWINDTRIPLSNSYWGAATNRVGFHLMVQSSGMPASRYQTQADGVGVWSVTGTTNLVGEWHQMAYVKEGTKISIVVDGQEENSRSDMPASIAGLAVYDRIRIGCNTSNARYFPGIIDEVRIWNHARTVAEIQDTMTHELRGTEEGLVGYWKLNEGQGTTVLDSAPVPHNGTIVGAAWTTETAPLTAGPAPAFAQGAAPAGGAVDVPQDIELSWKPGGYADRHDVYLGTAFADVNTASRTNPQAVLVSRAQTATAYQTTGLEYGQTYYWRVDEVNQAPDNTIFKGDLWSFTAEPYAYPVRPVAATASSAQATMGPEKTIDGSGLTGDLHGTEPGTMWLSGGAPPNWIQYEFDRAYKLYELQVWNSNQLIESFLGFGARKVTMETSLDGATWTPVADVAEFNQAPGAADYATNTTVRLGGAEAKYVKLTIDSTWGGTGMVTGLSEVRFTSIPVRAREPQPATAATNVGVDATLNWRPGREAASHEVFFGTDRTAVTNGTVAVQTVSDHSFDPGALNLGTTYYWRVDEVNAVTYAGPVWSFTTQPYQVVDDFESYTDQAGEEIFTTWVDGFDNPTKNGGIVGLSQAVNGTFGETTIVYGDKQSMPFAYDNSQAPLSEATRTFDTPQDWTAHGITALVLFFRGDAANAAAPVYIKINGTKVLYNNGALATTTPLWKQWNIDLTALGASVKSVRTFTIGVGNGNASEVGTIYVDDIRLYATPPAAAVPTDPGKNGLAAWWPFDGDFKDAAGTNHGSPKGDAKIVTDAARGQVLALDGTGDYVEFSNSPSLNITGDKISLAAWVNLNSVATVEIILCKVANDTTHASPYFSYSLHALANGQPRFWIARTGGTSNRAGTAGMLTVGTWHHVAGVYDGAQLKLYFDGALVGTTNATGNLNGYDTVLRIGTNGALTEQLDGKLDDVRIYNRPLSDMEIRYLVGDR
jgi:hypothetical protein